MQTTTHFKSKRFDQALQQKLIELDELMLEIKLRSVKPEMLELLKEFCAVKNLELLKTIDEYNTGSRKLLTKLDYFILAKEMRFE